MTHVVKFLQEHGPNGPEELMKRFFIHHSRNRSQPSLILFKYDQLNSPMSHPIVQECRGIILDESMNWEIVVYPYSKFFNMREVANAAVIDWTQPVRAYEKIDGSLMTMYWNHGMYLVSHEQTM
jgi:tRNA splicing ligase